MSNVRHGTWSILAYTNLPGNASQPIQVRSDAHARSWRNIVETLFGKMARTFLRHIRVRSREELRERVLKGIDEFNQAPVVHRWPAFQAFAVE